MPAAAKHRLFAPGPTPVPERVRLAMAADVLHHRTPAFMQAFAAVRADLAWLFQTAAEVLILAGTGTAAMDGSIANIFSPGDTAIFVDGGKFGERWGEILAAYGVHAVPVHVPWGEAVRVEAVAAALAAHPTARGVCMQACETSTAVRHPVAAIAALCAERPHTLSIVDAITALGVDDLALDRDRIDVLITASQKALMLPPGLAFVALSARAWQHQAQARLPRYYLDFARERAAASRNQSAWTSPVSLVVGLREALGMLREEGLPALFARHRRLAHAMRAGLAAMGCDMFADAAVAAHGVTAARPPKGIAPEALVQQLQDAFHLTVVGGQDAARGTIFRVAHMGHVDALDVLQALAAIELALAALGGDRAGGAGVAAAQAALQGD